MHIERAAQKQQQHKRLGGKRNGHPQLLDKKRRCDAIYPAWQPAMINTTGFGKNPSIPRFSVKQCAIKRLLT
jgi:hypothetical protein